MHGKWTMKILRFNAHLDNRPKRWTSKQEHGTKFLELDKKYPRYKKIHTDASKRNSEIAITPEDQTIKVDSCQLSQLRQTHSRTPWNLLTELRCTVVHSGSISAIKAPSKSTQKRAIIKRLNLRFKFFARISPITQEEEKGEQTIKEATSIT